MLKSLKLRLAALLALPALIAAPALAQQGPATSEPGIVLFGGANFSGDAREVFDVAPELPYIQFNDRAKSLVVLGGVWEVCQHSDFRGRCIVVREDVRDLRDFRLSRRISSVRPILEYTDAQHGLMFSRGSDGRIRYLDDYYDQYAGYDRNYGYDRTSLYIGFGYSDYYRRNSYYHPRLGYGPYGYGFDRGRRRVGYGHGYRRGYGVGRGHGVRRPVHRPHRPRVHRPHVDRRPDRRRPVVDRRPDRRPDVDRRPRTPRDVVGGFVGDDTPRRRRPVTDRRPDRRPDVDRPRRRDPSVDRPRRRPVADTAPAQPRVAPSRPERPTTRPRPERQPRADRPARRERTARPNRANRGGGNARTRGQNGRSVRN